MRHLHPLPAKPLQPLRLPLPRRTPRLPALHTQENRLAMPDRKLDIFPENHVPSSYQTYRQHGLIADDEIHLFQQYAQPDEPAFCARLRARGYSIWHAATRTQILKREWHFYRNTLHLTQDDLLIPPNHQPHPQSLRMQSLIELALSNLRPHRGNTEPNPYSHNKSNA